MKRGLLRPLCLVVLVFIGCRLAAQDIQHEYRRMFRVYDDNDALKIFGKISDRAYSNGTRLDYFYTPDKTPRFFIDRLMPKAGDSSLNTYGLGLMQIMITPRDLRKTDPIVGDYQYAGALFLTHTLHSTNERKKLNLQSEWILGVMGPPAMAKETQLLLHDLVRFTRPRGWHNQLPTDLLLNYNLAVEKGISPDSRSIDWIGGGKVYLGTMLNGGSVYTLLRVGKMNSYFKSYMGQFSTGTKAKNRFQYYLTIRPGVDLILYNALLKGGVFNKKDPAMYADVDSWSNPSVRKLVGHIDIGAVVSIGRLTVSYTHITTSGLIRGLPHHSVGNISVYLAW